MLGIGVAILGPEGNGVNYLLLVFGKVTQLYFIFYISLFCLGRPIFKLDTDGLGHAIPINVV